MKKYELKKDSIEIKWRERASIKRGVVLTAYNQEPECLKVFKEKDEALEELKSLRAEITEMSGYFLIEEYYVIEAEYEDGEPVEYGDILGVSEMKIEVIEKPSYDVVAVFDNFKDAEEAADNYEGDGEAYLSYCE